MAAFGHVHVPHAWPTYTGAQSASTEQLFERPTSVIEPDPQAANHSNIASFFISALLRRFQPNTPPEMQRTGRPAL